MTDSLVVSVTEAENRRTRGGREMEDPRSAQSPPLSGGSALSVSLTPPLSRAILSRIHLLILLLIPFTPGDDAAAKFPRGRRRSPRSGTRKAGEWREIKKKKPRPEITVPDRKASLSQTEPSAAFSSAGPYSLADFEGIRLIRMRNRTR